LRFLHFERRSRPRSPFRFGAATHRGPWVRRTPRRPARPRTFFRERIGRMTRVHPHRENEGGWPEPEFKFRDTHALIPPRFSKRENRGAFIITPRHDTARVSKVQQYATVTKTGTTSVMLHRAAPSLGWRAWNAYATIQALSSMKTKKANWGDKNLMAGQRRNLMKCLPGGGQVGRESEKKCR